MCGAAVVVVVAVVVVLVVCGFGLCPGVLVVAVPDVVVPIVVAEHRWGMCSRSYLNSGVLHQ